MKEKYIAPKAEFAWIGTEDILTASNTWTDPYASKGSAATPSSVFTKGKTF